MTIKIDAYGMSNVGMKRFQNEDSYLINDGLGLYIVADGMGGHLGGEFASKLAVTTIEEVLEKLCHDPEATHIEGIDDGEDQLADFLKHAVNEAGRRIYQKSLYDENLRGMGTTVVSILTGHRSIYIANVGDSRAYLIRKGEIKQVTEDHSLVSEQVKAGVLREDEAKGHKLKNIITRSVGYQEEVDSDLIELQVEEGDKLLMCSDGLTNLVEDDEILKMIRQHELKESCELLVQKANGRGGDDNITVIILQVDEIT